jgi:hypothetical protein
MKVNMKKALIFVFILLIIEISLFIIDYFLYIPVFSHQINNFIYLLGFAGPIIVITTCISNIIIGVTLILSKEKMDLVYVSVILGTIVILLQVFNILIHYLFRNIPIG